MVDLGTPTKGGKWVCPNDRQLALRAKLQTGWSVKTQDLQEYGKKPQALNETEQNIIKQVIQRAELLDQKEQERVGRLVDRLDNMKRNIMGNGTTQCILCGDGFGMFGTSNFTCNDCKKLVCDKCGVEILSSSQESLWLCKICSETREMWKKSGAWFFKGLPKYKLPEKKAEKYGPRKITRPGLAKNNWSKLSMESPASSNGELNKAEAEEETSSEEERKMTCRTVKQPEEQTRVQQGNSSTLNVLQTEKAPRSPGTMSTVSGSLFFNTSSDSGMGESERNPGTDKPVGHRYQREVSNESSESNNSTFSRQTSSTFSESQPNLTSSTAYLSSINQSYERLSLNYEQKDIGNYDRSPTSNSSSLGKKSPVEFDRTGIRQTQDECGYERVGRKLPVPGCKAVKQDHEKKELDVQKHRKKVSIDFGKAAAFLRHPLKGDKKKTSKAMEHSTSESFLDSAGDGGRGMWRKCGRAGGGNLDYYESGRGRQEELQSDLGANHWMSQESEMDVTESMTDLNSKWRESMSSLSRDYYWPEDQISLSSSSSLTPYDGGEVVGNQNAHLGVLELSVRHDPIRMCLHCTVHRVKGLRGTDIHGLADPFCKLALIPLSGKSKYSRTKTVHRTINPEFNETVSFYGVTEVDVQRRMLHIMVLDDDKCQNSFLGEARIPLFRIGSKTRNVKVFLEKFYQTEDDESSWEEKRWNRKY
ncbi:UNVERIFIED_CONTAM: hypothetical protein PYX00_009650 [Menopon gallinae]|uniref:Uncharacterized protein n=1 Tax=Menopon gallinae TaxID=328185 RepID=A0AAW2HCL5_9NEOP